MGTPVSCHGNLPPGTPLIFSRSLSDLGVRREGKRDRDQNLCKFEANSGLFNEDLRKFWPISAFPQQNHPKSDRLLDKWIRMRLRSRSTSVSGKPVTGQLIGNRA
uniref:Uncharacterized protein n=1 Tax=Candidatus Kentrum sp. DK TaxID=2126562 RepID=A0A450SQZ4_9GAMM|nr:MAG: hypothetical protein BECKDK2373B_GA0170837_10589 [Candidatus Kentron sp. DK]